MLTPVALSAVALAAALLAPPPGGGPAPEPRPGGEAIALPSDRPLVAGFLVVDGVYDTELVAPLDVLQHTAHHTAPAPGIEVLTVSPDGGPITTAEGLRLTPDHGFADAPPLDILVVASAEGSRDRDLENRELIAWVAGTGHEAKLVISLCWGAFVLAEAGLLEGRPVTTFPGDYESFAARFPALDLRVNVSFVHSGKVITSQGGARSFDAAIYLVERLYGRDVAQAVGRGLLLDWPPGGAAHPGFVSDPAFRVERLP